MLRRWVSQEPHQMGASEWRSEKEKRGHEGDRVAMMMKMMMMIAGLHRL